MPEQDPRITEDALQEIEYFFTSLARRNNAQVAKFLELEPTLIYARDEQGDTALNCLILSGTERALETLRIVINSARAQRVEPDLTLKNNNGNNAWNVLGAIKEPVLFRAFVHLLDPTIQFEDYSHSSDNDVVAKSKAYFEKTDIKASQKTLKEIERGDKKDCTIMNLHKIIYKNNPEDIFKKLEPLNFDQQKQFNQLDAESAALLKGFSFTPMDFDTTRNSDDLSIIIIPKELLSISIEEINNMIGKIHNYFFGPDQH